MMQNPWKGLAAYKEPKAGDEFVYKFCGRESATIELATLIENNLCVTVYGRTGIGKTSLLEAGVFPKVRRSSYLPISVRFSMMDSDDTSFAEYIIENIEQQVEAIRKTSAKEVSPLKDGQCNIDFLWEYFATRRFYVSDKEVYPLIVLDQFEENFLLNRQETWRLIEQIYSLINDNKIYPDDYHDETNFRIVIAIREDDLYRLEDCVDQLHLTDLKFNRYRLAYLSDDDARNVISIPGNDCLPKEEEEREPIVSEIIRIVKEGNDGNINTLVLSLVCSVLYDKMEAKRQTTITLNDVRSLGVNPLIDFYLSIATKIPRQRLFLEDRLVDDDGRRNTVNVEEMDLNFPNWRMFLNGSKRILQESNRKVELVHDMLAKAIYDVKLRRQKKKKKRILQIGVICLIFLIGGLSLLSSVFTLNNNPYSEHNYATGLGIPFFPKKEIVCGDTLPTNLLYKNQIERMVIEEGCPDDHITNFHVLTHLVIKKSYDGTLHISECPNLTTIELQCDSIYRLNIEQTPYLQTIILPDYIKNINIEKDVYKLIPRSTKRYVWLDDILWDIQEKRVVYSANHTGKACFPYECKDKKSTSYYNYIYHRRDTIVNDGEWIDNILFSDQGKTIKGHRSPIAPALDLSIYANLSRVKSGAFSGSAIRKVTLKDSVTYENLSFGNCEHLDTVILTNMSSEVYNNIHNSGRITYVTGMNNRHFTKKEGVVYLDGKPVFLSAEFEGDYFVTQKQDANLHDTILLHGVQMIRYGNKLELSGYTKTNKQTIIEDLNDFWGKGFNIMSWGVSYGNLGFFLIPSTSEIYLVPYINNLSFSILPTTTETIHVSNPKFKNFTNLPDSIRSRISLYVPYGCIDIFSHRKEFAGFKEIKEESLSSTIRNNIYYSIQGITSTFAYTPIVRWLFGASVFLVFLLFTALSFSRIRGNAYSLNKTIRYAIANGVTMVAIGIFSWTACYWFVWYGFVGNMWICSLIAVIFALLILFALYYNVLFEIGRIHWKKVFRHAVLIARQCFELSTYRKIIARVKRQPMLAFVFIAAVVGIVVCLCLWISRSQQNKYAEHVIQVVGKLNNDYGLLVLVDFMEKSKNVDTDIYWELDSLLRKMAKSHEITTEQNYNNIQINGHENRIRDINISADGKYLASSDRKLVKIWNIENYHCVNTMKMYDCCVAFAPDGDALAYGDSYGHVNLYHWRDTSLTEIWKERNWSDINDILFNEKGNLLIAASDDNTIHVWNITSKPKEKRILEGHTDDVTSVCISPDEKYLYSCSLDSTVRQWDMAKGICVDTIKFTNHLNSIAMRSDGTGIAVAGYGYTYLYAIPDGEIHTLSHYGRALIEDLCFSPDGKYLVVASQGAIQLWDVSETPTPCDTFSEDCYACCFSKDGNLLYTGHYKGEIRVWSMDELLEKGSTAFLLEACKSHLKEKEIALTDRFKEKWKLK